MYGVTLKKKNLIYLLITIRLATCFEPTGSSSGLHYEPVNVRRRPDDDPVGSKHVASLIIINNYLFNSI